MKRKKIHKVHFVLIGIAVVSLTLLLFKVPLTKDNSQSAQQAKIKMTEEELEAGGHDDYEEPAPITEPVYIEITKNGFIPQSLIVNTTDNIAWVNKDTIVHTAIAESTTENSFNTGVIKPKEKIPAVSYERAGNYTYYCQLHPNENGTIIVKDK